MPLWYHFPLPALREPQHPIRLVKWLLQEGEPVHVGTEVLIVETALVEIAGVETALVEIAPDRFTVLANGEGSLREKLFPVGAELRSGTPVAVINADGECIPYGREFSIARPG